MFIERQQHPAIEFDPAAGQQEPALVHFFSNVAEPFRSALPLLAADECVLVVSSPLSELLNEVIRIHREPDWPDQVVVDERHRAFFEAVKVSLGQALAKLEQIEYAALDDQDDES